MVLEKRKCFFPTQVASIPIRPRMYLLSALLALDVELNVTISLNLVSSKSTSLHPSIDTGNFGPGGLGVPNAIHRAKLTPSNKPIVLP